jgi:hypothetical protein
LRLDVRLFVLSMAFLFYGSMGYMDDIRSMVTGIGMFIKSSVSKKSLKRFMIHRVIILGSPGLE